MATSLNDLSHVEPSSDFPTADDVSPCSFVPRGASAVVIALVVALVAFLVGRAVAGRRRPPG